MQPPRSQIADRLLRLTGALLGLRALVGLIGAIFNIGPAWFRYGIELPLAVAWLVSLGVFLLVRGREIVQFRRDDPHSNDARPANPSA